MKRPRYWASPIVLGRGAEVAEAPLAEIDLRGCDDPLTFAPSFAASAYRSGTIVLTVGASFPEADIEPLRTDVEQRISANGHNVKVRVERAPKPPEPGEHQVTVNADARAAMDQGMAYEARSYEDAQSFMTRNLGRVGYVEPVVIAPGAPRCMCGAPATKAQPWGSFACDVHASRIWSFAIRVRSS